MPLSIECGIGWLLVSGKTWENKGVRKSKLGNAHARGRFFFLTRWKMSLRKLTSLLWVKFILFCEMYHTTRPIVSFKQQQFHKWFTPLRTSSESVLES